MGIEPGGLQGDAPNADSQAQFLRPKAFNLCITDWDTTLS